MADVSVEFGAKDVGLQESLKKIQSEMQTLEGKVKSGELSFEELESTMKRLGQVERLEKQLQAIGNESAGAAPKVGELGKDIQDAGNKSEKMGEQSGMGFGKFVAGVGLGQIAAKAFTAVLDSAFAAVRGTIQGFTDALDLGGRLSDLSASTGETAGKLLVLERAFDNSGIGAEKVGSTIAKMQKNIEDARDGSGAAAQAFAMMGVTVDELEGKLPTEQFKILSSGINSIEDPTQRAAASMGAFGKTGAELIPLLTNLEGELGEARDTVGSMAEIMDRRSSVFDAVGDRFKTIGEKVRDFAAGILDKALPAIDAITSALSRIDAAKIGQNLADAFLGGEQAMKGFQAAVDAISIGKVGLAFEVFWESLKLQAMQSGNAIYKYLSAGLQTAADTIVDLFGPSSGTFTLLIDSFAFAGKASGVKFAQGILAMLPDINDGLLKTINLAATFLPNIAGPAALAFNAANKGLDALRGSMDGMEANLEKQKETLGASFENFSVNAKKQIGEIPKEFEQNLASANAEFFKTGEQAALVKTLQDEVTAATAATTSERATQAAQTEAELAKRQELRAAAEAAAATEQANAVALVELETAINAAKAEGNEQLVKTLESEKQQLEGQQEIAKLTEEYKTKLGVNADEAARLANNFVAAKNAAAAIGDRSAIVTITTTVDDTRWKDLLAELSANSNPKAIAVALEVTGKDNVQDAFATLQNMETINKNHQVAMDVLGAKSLEEVKMNLDAVATPAQAQLAMQITGEDDLKSAIGNLDSFKGTKTAKALLEKQGFENIDQLKDALKGIIGEKRTKMIVESLGVKDAEAAKEALTAILNANGKKATITADADTNPAEKKIEELSTKTAKVPLDADTAPLKTSLDKFTSNAQKLTLDASDAIKTIRAELEKPIKLDLSGATGSGGSGDNSPGGLTGLVTDIKHLLTTLSNKLPSHALTV